MQHHLQAHARWAGTATDCCGHPRAPSSTGAAAATSAAAIVGLDLDPPPANNAAFSSAIRPQAATTSHHAGHPTNHQEPCYHPQVC
jgi:hypothetical protein